jgi:uncharacterized protein YndB with AHSA1/START domain
MTKQKSFKRRVRTRMTKTGERYAAARRTLMERADRRNAKGTADADAAAQASDKALEATTPTGTAEPTTSDAAAVKATGRRYGEWFAILDEWGAASRPHPEIARWLGEEHGVPSWWRQSVTVSYERARGLRAVGQRTSGWSVSATRTVEVPVERLFAAFDDADLRRRWLGGADLRTRTTTPPRSARYDWEAGPSRVEVSFVPAGPAKSRVAVEHSRLADAEETARMKRFWRERLGALKAMLEG